jgi:hypothetical protein
MPTGDDGTGSDSDDPGVFDVAEGATAGDDGVGDDGCTKIDFLFVIDNSNSMLDNQLNLLNNYPGFMDAITQTLEVDDFHVMVADTDSVHECSGACDYWSGEDECTWLDKPCRASPEQAALMTECDETLGAGVTLTFGDDANGELCEFVGGNRFMTSDEPDLVSAFECAAKVGTSGDSYEQQMEAVLAALSPELSEPGGCNEGFLRDDAILVVTMLTDEPGLPSQQLPPGTVEAWREGLVAAKGGNEEAVVFLGIVPDGLPFGQGVCLSDLNFAFNFVELAESLPHGAWASVCETDYKPFFEDAVSFIDTACEDFVPPG